MKIKKLLTGFLATAIAVSAMAVSVSAAEESKAYFKPWSGESGEATNFVFNGQWAGGWVQFTPIDDEDAETDVKIADAADFDIVFEITVEQESAEEMLFKAGDTNVDTYSVLMEDGKKDYKVTFSAADLNTQTDGENVGFNFQNGAAEKATVTVYAVKKGTDAPAETEKPADEDTEKPAETEKPADTSKDGDGKGSPSTGVEDVVAVSAIALLATGTVVFARKRK